MIAKLTVSSAYVLCVVVSNYLTASFGLVPVGFGFTATAGTYTAGLSLLARDTVQDLTNQRTVLYLILIGTVLSGFLSGPNLALASCVAFLVSEVADMWVYTPLRKKGLVKAVLASNVVGAFVDSILFLWIAGFPITAIYGQMIGKGWVTLIPIMLILIVRGGSYVVLRKSQH